MSQSILFIKKKIYPIKYFFIIISLIKLKSIFNFFLRRSNNEYREIFLKGIGKPLQIRSNSITDRNVFKYVFWDKYHVPPVKLRKQPVIVDCGSNIGFTLLHFSQMYPDAKIYGYEMDVENYRLCLENIKAYNNIKVYNRAIWWESATVEYSINTNSDAFSIQKNESNLNIRKIKSIRIDDIIKENNLIEIDYLKIDIEGAEIEILNRKLEWIHKVKCLNIEIHDKKFIPKAINIIETYGFTCWHHPSHSFSVYANKL